MLLVNSLVGLLAEQPSTAAEPSPQSSPRGASPGPSRSFGPVPTATALPTAGTPAVNSRAAAPADAGAPNIEPPIAARRWKSIVVHHSATAGGDVAAIDAVHRTQKDRAGKPWRGIGYHFVVGNGRPMVDGEVVPTFRWREQLAGAHTSAGEFNEQGIGICLIGNFDEQAPSRLQVAAARRLVSALAARFEIESAAVLRHGDVQATRCPGRMLPWDQIKPELSPAKTP